MDRILRGLLASVLWMVGTIGLSAAQRIVLDGFIEAVTSDYSDSADYIFRNEREGRIRFAILDPQRRLTASLPDRLRCTVEFTFDRLPNDVPLVTLLSVDKARLAFAGSVLSDPALWAGRDNGLFPSFDEPLPRYFSSAGGNFDTDSDGDGVPDTKDDFPNDPNETTDTDGDGIGDNADPDDDNDAIPDEYEISHGLDPLADDANEDLDRDGKTNLEEYLAGTAADDPNSRFEVADIGVAPDGTVRLSWFARADRIYDILSSPDLVTAFEIIPGKEGLTVETDDLHTEDLSGVTDKFFILGVKPPPAP